jgi:copper chaperone CopZ
MHKFLLALFISLLTLPTTVSATEKSYDIIIEASGMVCDFCAQSLTKVFSKKDSVESIDVDLDKSTVNVTLKDDGVLSDDEIKELIEWGGYDLISINRK